MKAQQLSNFPTHDPCGIHLDHLVVRGHYLFAKVQKLSNEIPPCFHYDFILQKHKSASVKDGEKRGKMSSLWKKLYSKPETKVVIRQQVGSYSHQGGTTSSIGTQSKRNSNDQVSGAEFNQKDGKYQSILIDFAYLGNPEKYDSHSHILREEDNEEERRKKIADQEHLESGFICEYDACLREYYQLFSDVLAYYYDIHRFLGDLERGHYVLYSVDTLLQHQQGVKHLAELLYIYGTLLIAMEMYIPGTIRERFIIAHRRYCRVNSNTASLMENYIAAEGGSRFSDNFEPLCKLFQRTEVDSNDRDTDIVVPENYLNRMKLPSSVTEKVLECLLTQEIYEMEKRSFPSFRYMSTRLSMQASMIFVMLNFEPHLFRQEDKMRQIIDKMFYDNWVVPMYNGELVDLSVEWNQRYPVARQALDHILTERKIQSLNSDNAKQVMLCTEEIRRYIDQNILTDLYVLEHLEELLECARASNVALKWRLLHKDSSLLATDKKGSKDTSAVSVVDDRDIVDLFLLGSSFEATLREICLRLVEDKQKLWSSFRASAVSKMQQLSSYFYGNDSLAHVQKNDKMGIWFNEMATEIRALEFTGTYDDVQFFMDSLNDIGNLHQLDSNSQIKNLILETKLQLVRMVKCEEKSEDIDSIIDTISDASYARVAIEYFIPIFHSRSLKDPKSVGYLRPTFIKISSFLRQVKTSQSTNYDGNFAKTYHSEALLYFVKEILNVIPLSIFSTYAMIVDMNEKSLDRIPTAVGSECVTDFSFEDHYKRAKLTFELSVLTKGIIDMKETFIGDLMMDPQEILEEGLRKELISQILSAMHTHLQFSTKSTKMNAKSVESTLQTFVETIHTLSRRMECFQKAIISLQDFLRMNGLEIYLQESARVIWWNTNIEMGKEASSSPLPALINASSFNLAVPIYQRVSDHAKSSTFMGRTLNQMLKLLDPQLCSYSTYLDGWFFHKSYNPVIDGKTFVLLRRAIGVQGLIAMETLICHKISMELVNLRQFYDQSLVTYGVTLEKFRDAVFPEWKVPKYGEAFYSSASTKLNKLFPPLNKIATRIGKLQLMRRLIKTELHLTSRIDAEKLLQTSHVINSDILMFLEKTNGKSVQHDHDILSIIKTASQLQEAVGGGNPMSTIYAKTDAFEGLPSLLTLFLIHYMPSVSLDDTFQALKGKEDESFDGWVIASGIGTLLRQFNPAYTKAFFSLFGQYVMCTMKKCLEKMESGDSTTYVSLRKKASHSLIFLKHLRDVYELDHNLLNDNIPQNLMDMFEDLDDRVSD